MTADAQSRQLRRRLYKGAAIATLVYVALSIINFLLQFNALPYELAIIWAVVVICYATFREALRWNNLDDTNYPGEFWAGLVVAGAIFMIAWNIGRGWLFRLPRIVFPQDYEAAVIEMIVLYTLSSISSFIYGRRSMRGKFARHRTRVKTAAEGRGIVVPQAQSIAGPVQNSEVKAVLTSAKTPNDKKEEKHTS